MRMIRTIGAALAVALVLSLSVVGLTTSSATALTASAASTTTTATSHARVRDGYGAIALNKRGRYGTSKNYPTKSGAYRRALQECNKGGPTYPCVKIGWVRNACAAVWFALDSQGFVVSKVGKKPHFGWARSLSRAVQRARQGHTGGHVVKVCT